jgi:Flp pilus assembly protein TadD
VAADPLSTYANAMLGMTYSAAGRYTEAVEISKRAVELDADSFLSRCSLQWALRFSRRFEDAVAACNSALAISGRHPWALSSLAMIFADWGRPADAESVYAEMTARSRREYVAPAQLAIAATAVGTLDEAICHAREAFEIRDPFCRIQFSKYWPDTARLREDTRFQRILVEFGLD